MNNSANGERAPSEAAFYGVIRANSQRRWHGWPVQIFFATVSGTGAIRSSTLIVRPSADWLMYRRPEAEIGPEDEVFFKDALDARTAANVLNEAFGPISVYCPDVRTVVGRLYDEGRIARTWGFTNFFIPFREHDIRVGAHAVLRMIDTVPETLGGEERVRAHAQAYLDLCRAHGSASEKLSPIR